MILRFARQMKAESLTAPMPLEVKSETHTSKADP